MPSLSPRFTSADSVVAALRTAGCVFAEDEARLILAAARTPDELAGMVDLRITGHPLELVVGWAEFRGLRITVGPGVFVPRRRTEFLVEQALAQAPDASVVVDLCCGSGAVGAALAAALGPIELHAADIDPVAGDCAPRRPPGPRGPPPAATPPTRAAGPTPATSSTPSPPTCAAVWTSSPPTSPT